MPTRSRPGGAVLWLRNVGNFDAGGNLIVNACLDRNHTNRTAHPQLAAAGFRLRYLRAREPSLAPAVASEGRPGAGPARVGLQDSEKEKPT
jgi:hypothetical protein